MSDDMTVNAAGGKVRPMLLLPTNLAALAKLTVELPPIKGTLAQILKFKWETRD